MIHLLRHGNQVHRENDGAIEFWRIKVNLQKHFPYCTHWSWRQVEEKHGKRRRKQEKIPVLYWFVRNNLVPPSSSKSFRTQSHWSYFTGQCVDSERFLRVHLSHRICNQFTLHHEFRIDTGRSKILATERQYSFCLWIPWTKNHKDLDTIDLEAPGLAQYMHKAWKKHQNTVYRVDFNLALKKGLKFYQTRSNAIILHETLPAYCIPKVVRMETGEVIFEKVTSASSKDLPETWLEKRIGFRRCSTTRRTSCATIPKVSNRTNQFQTQIMTERGNPLLEPIQRGQPVVGTNPRNESSGRKTSRSQEIDTRSFHEAVKNDRTGQPGCWNRKNPNTFIWWQQESQRWNGTW